MHWFSSVRMELVKLSEVVGFDIQKL